MGELASNKFKNDLHRMAAAAVEDSPLEEAKRNSDVSDGELLQDFIND